MKSQKQRPANKQKQIAKKQRRNREQEDDEPGEDFNVVEELEQEQPHHQELRLQKYESPEEVKKRLAKEALQKIQPRKGPRLEDDFFIVEDEREESKHIEHY